MLNTFRNTVLIVVLIVLASCQADPSPDTLPTIAVLPSATLVARVLPTLIAQVATTSDNAVTDDAVTDDAGIVRAIATETVSPSPLPPTLTLTHTPTDTQTPIASMTPSRTPTVTASATRTLVPSLTITNTLTPIPSPTLTPSPELGLFGDLAALSARATILPPDRLYNAPTLTALYFAGQAYVVTQGAATAAAANQSNPALATPPGGALACAIAAPALLAAETALGCPLIAAPFPTVTGAQSFERGTMIFVQGPPNTIYVLTPDGRFRRFDDTWRAGIDPETLNETAPPGLVTPKRGFGKVWSSFPDVRALLGWAIADESGSTGAQVLYERGRAVGVPVRGEVYLLVDDPGGASGTWRVVAGGL
ncbi:MAG: hypothetical protein SGJ24_05375 [Chloroflexota bacterium]|nr:hypothetical protein [Chloroflexota bacterium]